MKTLNLESETSKLTVTCNQDMGDLIDNFLENNQGVNVLNKFSVSDEISTYAIEFNKTDRQKVLDLLKYHEKSEGFCPLVYSIDFENSPHNPTRPFSKKPRAA